jgi:hypothetical protein
MAEKLIQSLNDSARAMLLQASMPQQFWSEAVITAAYVKNLLPRQQCRTLRTGWHNRQPPPLDHLRPFGCIVYPHIIKERRPKQSKYLSHATKCCLINYDHTTGDYRYYDFKRNVFDKTNHILIKEHHFPTTEDLLTAFPAPFPDLYADPLMRR